MTVNDDGVNILLSFKMRDFLTMSYSQLPPIHPPYIQFSLLSVRLYSGLRPCGMYTSLPQCCYEYTSKQLVWLSGAMTLRFPAVVCVCVPELLSPHGISVYLSLKR